MADLATILAFGFIIAFHEFGHFIIARLLGAKVDYFSIGFGPVLFSFKYKGTEFLISAIPVGGYVKPAGGSFREDLKPGDSENKNYIVSRPAWQRFSVYIAGPLFNLILAVILISGMALRYGMPVGMTRVIDAVVEGSPAEKAGLKKGDKIIAVGKKKVGTWEELVTSIVESDDENLLVKVKRQNEILDIVVTPEVRNERRVIGILPEVEKERAGVLSALKAGVYGTWTMAKMQLKGIAGLISGKISTKDMSGPVGIIQITSKAAKRGMEDLLSLMVMISVALGVFNLLPVPILDGGWLLLISIEVLLGRPLGKKIQIAVLAFGFMLLMSLMLFVTYNDILRLFGR